MNKKRNDIVTLKNAQLVAQDYAQIKWVDFDEISIPIDHIESIRRFLSLS